MEIIIVLIKQLFKDAKMTFTFADYKVSVPWTIVYQAKNGSTIQEISLKFYHDDFEVQRLDHQITYTKEMVINRLHFKFFFNFIHYITNIIKYHVNSFLVARWYSKTYIINI